MLLGNALLLLTTLSLVFILVISPFVRRVANHYWFWFVAGLFVFLYVMFGRQIKYIVPTFAEELHMSDSARLSRIFLLDLCPFYAIFGSLSLMLKNKSIAKVLAPFGFFGAAVTLFGEVFFQANDVQQRLYWDYIFLGIGGNEMYFMMHFLSLILSFMIICWIRGWNLKLYISAIGFAILYFSYIMIVVRFRPEIIANTTGVLPADWLPGGEYQGVGHFLNIDSYPEVMIAGYSLATFAISLVFWVNYGVDTLIVKFNLNWQKQIVESAFYKKISNSFKKASETIKPK